MDDLCHGGDQTLCGLERYFDFCEHDFIPETCPHGCDGAGEDEFLDDGAAYGDDD